MKGTPAEHLYYGRKTTDASELPLPGNFIKQIIANIEDFYNSVEYEGKNLAHIRSMAVKACMDYWLGQLPEGEQSTVEVDAYSDRLVIRRRIAPK